MRERRASRDAHAAIRSLGLVSEGTSFRILLACRESRDSYAALAGLKQADEPKRLLTASGTLELANNCVFSVR